MTFKDIRRSQAAIKLLTQGKHWELCSESHRSSLPSLWQPWNYCYCHSRRETHREHRWLQAQLLRFRIHPGSHTESTAPTHCSSPGSEHGRDTRQTCSWEINNSCASGVWVSDFLGVVNPSLGSFRTLSPHHPTVSSVSLMRVPARWFVSPSRSLSFAATEVILSFAFSRKKAGGEGQWTQISEVPGTEHVPQQAPPTIVLL